VPDWSVTEHFGYDHAQLERYDLFPVCKLPITAINCSLLAQGLLRLSTIRFCITEAVGPSMPEVTDEETRRRPMYEEWNQIYATYTASRSAKGFEKGNTSATAGQFISGRDTSPPYVGRGTSNNAFSRIVVFDHFSALGQQENTVRASPNHKKLFWPVWNVLIGRAKDNIIPAKSNNEGVLVGIRECTTSRAFFITKRGYFGLGPGKLKAGDEIHIAIGERYPLVVRRVGVESEKWKGKVKGQFYTLVG
jgi:hypothetical protein